MKTLVVYIDLKISPLQRPNSIGDVSDDWLTETFQLSKWTSYGNHVELDAEHEPFPQSH